MIVADDHGWNDLGCYGHPVARTPHLDRLAADGVRFERCFTTAPLCSPGRGAVMTGLYPHVNGVTRLVQGPEADALSLDPAVWTMAKGFREMGYATAAARKWHLSTAGPTAHKNPHAVSSNVALPSAAVSPRLIPSADSIASIIISPPFRRQLSPKHTRAAIVPGGVSLSSV